MVVVSPIGTPFSSLPPQVVDSGRSSNGRTADSGSAYRGSNPCLPVKSFKQVIESGLPAVLLSGPLWRLLGGPQRQRPISADQSRRSRRPTHGNRLEPYSSIGSVVLASMAPIVAERE